jgi:predicted nucleotidyltransferase
MNSLPSFQSNGNLPSGIWRVSWEEFSAYFGHTNARRSNLLSQLTRLIDDVRRATSLVGLYVFGSYVTSKTHPGDLDLLLVVQSGFQTEDLDEILKLPFDHEQARRIYECDVFWIGIAPDSPTLALLLDTYQRDRNRSQRGIVEILL